MKTFYSHDMVVSFVSLRLLACNVFSLLLSNCNYYLPSFEFCQISQPPLQMSLFCFAFFPPLICEASSLDCFFLIHCFPQNQIGSAVGFLCFGNIKSRLWIAFSVQDTCRAALSPNGLLRIQTFPQTLASHVSFTEPREEEPQKSARQKQELVRWLNLEKSTQDSHA